MSVLKPISGYLFFKVVLGSFYAVTFVKQVRFALFCWCFNHDCLQCQSIKFETSQGIGGQRSMLGILWYSTASVFSDLLASFGSL